MPTHLWKDLSINFMMSFLILANWKSNSYDLTLVIVNRLIKMVYYEPVKVTINALDLTKVIVNIIICHYKILKSIIMNRDLLFTSKF